MKKKKARKILLLALPFHSRSNKNTAVHVFSLYASLFYQFQTHSRFLLCMNSPCIVSEEFFFFFFF